MNINKGIFVNEINGYNHIRYVILSEEYGLINLDSIWYSKEQNFISEHFGANERVRKGKLVLFTLNDKNELLSLSNIEGDTLVITSRLNEDLTRSDNGNERYIFDKYRIDTQEYEMLVKSKINCYKKKLNK